MGEGTMMGGRIGLGGCWERRTGGRGLSVWKHVFCPYVTREIRLHVPRPAQVLALDWEGDNAVVWLRVAPALSYCERRLLVVQTHTEGLPPARYVGTSRNPAGCAFHLFDLDEPDDQAYQLATAAGALDLAA